MLVWLHGDMFAHNNDDDVNDVVDIACDSELRRSRSTS
jgi:hypothetical protein